MLSAALGEGGGVGKRTQGTVHARHRMTMMMM